MFYSLMRAALLLVAVLAGCGDNGKDCECAVPSGMRIACGNRVQRAAVDIADEHSCPFPGERARRREADARGTGSHEHAQSGNLQVHALPVMLLEPGRCVCAARGLTCRPDR